MKSFQEWMKEGEDLYANALTQYQTLESQIEELEKQLAEKKAEVNQIAQMIGKSPVESGRRAVSGQIVEPERQQPANNSTSAAAIARAITGRSLGR